MAMHISRWFRRMARMADLTRRVWRAIVWYLREVSGEARYGRYHNEYTYFHQPADIQIHPHLLP